MNDPGYSPIIYFWPTKTWMTESDGRARRNSHDTKNILGVCADGAALPRKDYILGVFIGKDSLGFEHSKTYEIRIYSAIYPYEIVSKEGLWCPYSGIAKLLENWRIIF